MLRGQWACLIMRSCPKRPHYAYSLHPDPLSVRLSHHFVYPVPTVNSEIEITQCSYLQYGLLALRVTGRAILRSKVKGHFGRKCDNRFWRIYSRKMHRFTQNQDQYDPIPCCMFCPIQRCSETDDNIPAVR